MNPRSLSVRSVGPDVKAIQQALNVWGAKPALDPDGTFGNHTDAAVRRFQTAHNLKPDGIVGKNTRAALFPVGVATMAIFGMRLRMPNLPPFKANTPSLLPQRLQLPGDGADVDGQWSSEICQGFRRCWRFPNLQLPGLKSPIPAPSVPDWNLKIPSLPNTPSAAPLGFVYDHAELQPGAQTTFLIRAQRVDAFVLTMQNVYRRGPDSGAHQEVDLGVQIGTPFSDPNGPWTVNPFIQLTDVDRIGALGMFHLWQPYASIGFQFSGLGNPQPSLTGNLFPFNVGVDFGDSVTLNLAAGLALTLDLQSGRVQAGTQITSGITVKFGQPETKGK